MVQFAGESLIGTKKIAAFAFKAQRRDPRDGLGRVIAARNQRCRDMLGRRRGVAIRGEPSETRVIREHAIETLIGLESFERLVNLRRLSDQRLARLRIVEIMAEEIETGIACEELRKSG